MKLTSHDAKLRLYDGAGQYFELILDSADFSGPLAAPKHEQSLVLNRGKVDEFGFYQKGGDAPVLEPVSLSFSVTLADHVRCFEFLNLLEGNLVDGKEFASTKGVDAADARLGAISIPFDGDDRKTFTLEYAATGKTNGFAMRYAECHADMAATTFSESEESISLSVSINCYGNIARKLGFSEGTAIM